LVFRSYTEDVFTINTPDIKQPTQFVQIGETIKGTKFKVVSFTQKNATRDLGGSQVESDVSELLVENTENGQKLVLPKDVTVDSGESTVVLTYQFDGSEIRLKRDQEFKLPPKKDTTYRLVETNLQGAVILIVETGEKVIVPPAAIAQPVDVLPNTQS
jgi:hypothetical protein